VSSIWPIGEPASAGRSGFRYMSPHRGKENWRLVTLDKPVIASATSVPLAVDGAV
jgi:hypothetical protein